ncbi:MAG: hypothetical protein GJU73_02745 [Ferrovum sp.]|uniref:hypothetical protein n=1 Tax=Ferrovum sp. TaxID=2609467 RepID=UPI002606D850|nr:hypothetical protein [Ferrovum sp.]MBW8066339.1 hypothetical protein [Ferrovum sp.]
MTSRTEQFRRRQQKRAAQRQATPLVLLPDAGTAAALASAEVDNAFVDRPVFLDRFEIQADMSTQDPASLLAELAAHYQNDKVADAMLSTRTQIMDQIAGAFGLGKLVGLVDRKGGYVDTVHNVRQGVYATELERHRYELRGEYDAVGAAYRTHPNYIAKGRAAKQKFEFGKLFDEYTGERFRPSDVHHKQRRPTIDHIKSVKSTHNDAGRVLAEVDGVELANQDSNLAITSKTVNSAKRSDQPVEFGKRLAEGASPRRADIERLEASSTTLSERERKNLTKLKVLEAVDVERLERQEQRATQAMDTQINDAYYGSNKFVKAAGSAAATEGAKTGLRELVGEVLLEFLSASYDEMMDVWNSGRQEASIWREMTVRLKRIALRTASKWDQYIERFIEGGIAGLLSSLVTTLVNAFITTVRRVARMIREGLVSVARAVKIVLLPPEDADRSTVLHEATKVIVGGAIIIGGVALEEQIDKMLRFLPGLSLIADSAAPAIAGALTAMVTGLAIYGLDRLDLFGVNELARQRSIGEMLDQREEATVAQIEHMHSMLIGKAGE